LLTNSHIGNVGYILCHGLKKKVRTDPNSVHKGLQLPLKAFLFGVVKEKSCFSGIEIG